MNRELIKAQIRKVKWATERETGKKLGKKGLFEVQKVVMAMMPKEKVKEVKKANWVEKPKEVEIKTLNIDFSNLIGKRIEDRNLGRNR